MSDVFIESDEGELFGEKIIASFDCDVDSTYVPYEPETEYSPAEGGYTEINNFTFKMHIKSVDEKNSLLENFIRYENLSKEKQQEITKWVENYLLDYYDREDKSDDDYYEYDRDMDKYSRDYDY